ncbi:RING finger protein 113A [Thelohanellus kitauei]|uniref:RING finger protein 113A n=1 Tax=Thelohanellus kitauei TaxID=669202 RepID=A0A0C2IX84_THEKT|nr:RING finger protein 113A [Thelohanellus kitauei]
MELNKELQGKKDDGLYKGQAAYAKYFEKQDSILGKASSNLVRQGPYRASSNIRVTTRWDFEPNLCKDYKDTGFCGFGDSCKYVHDRTDYKAGWELERDYEAGLLQAAETNPYEIVSSEEEPESNCAICKSEFTNPVKTKCNHVFCEACALDHYRKNHKCFVCGSDTGGIFKHDKTGQTGNQTGAEPIESLVNEISNVQDSSGESPYSSNNSD